MEAFIRNRITSIEEQHVWQLEVQRAEVKYAVLQLNVLIAQLQTLKC